MQNATIDCQQLSEFLSSVGLGDQNKVETMLKENSDLGQFSGRLTDCSGRDFKKITGLQYAVWALDWHMWSMLMKYMTDETVVEQLTELNAIGLEVKEPGASSYETTTQISWQNLITALETYVEYYWKWDYNQCNDFWCNTVGGAQKLLPAHVIQEYSRKDRAFSPCPTFNENSLPRYDENWTVDKWFQQVEKGWIQQERKHLGFNYAWIRGNKSAAQAEHIRNSRITLFSSVVGVTRGLSDYNHYREHKNHAQCDCIALRELYHVRSDQRTQLIKQVVILPQQYSNSKRQGHRHGM